MVWHDCKTDPPKKDGNYLLWFKSYDEDDWDKAYYYIEQNRWTDLDDCINYGQTNWTTFCLIPYKWAEIDLSEVE